MFVLKLPREQKAVLVGRVQDYFFHEKGEEIGELPAELLIDFMIQTLGPAIYNQALDDAIKTVGERMLALEDDLHAMKKSR